MAKVTHTITGVSAMQLEELRAQRLEAGAERVEVIPAPDGTFTLIVTIDTDDPGPA